MEPSLEDRAISEICYSRFHRSFRLPPNPARNRHTPFRVTYSDFGRPAASTPEEEAGLPTVFFCGGLMGGRWMLTSSDVVARKKGVRIICVDRPGMGGTDAVPIDQRFDVWLEIVPTLLDHLSIRHVAVAAHSFGAVYAMNFLLNHRDLLHPHHPYAVVFAPWIHTSHTDSTVVAMTDFLPRAWIGGLHNVINFVSKFVAPSVGFSSGVISKLLPADNKPVVDASAPEDGEEEEEKKIRDIRDWKTMKFVFAEEIAGASDDALLALRRTDNPNPWGAWGDFDTGAPRLAAQELAKGPRKPDEAALKIEAIYGENDHLTGTTGWKWFDKCWTDACMNAEGALDFESRICRGTNHDNVLDRKYGALDDWLDKVAASFRREEGISGFI